VVVSGREQIMLDNSEFLSQNQHQHFQKWRCTEFCVNELIAVNLLDQTARSLQTSSKAV